MSKARQKGGPAEIQRSLLVQVKSIAAHTQGIRDDLTEMAKSFRDGIQNSTDPTADLLSATSQLSTSTFQACSSLRDCLNDLVGMGEAMTPVLESSAEAAPALLLNFYSTFVTQMNNFLSEMSTDWAKGTQGFVRGKAAFFRESAPPTPRVGTGVSSAASATPVAATAPKMPSKFPATTSPQPAATDEDADEAAPVPLLNPPRRRKHGLLEEEVEQQDELSSGAAPAKKPGKKKKNAAAAAAAVASSPLADDGDDQMSTGGGPSPTSPGQQHLNGPNGHSSRYDSQDSMAALAAAAESGAQTAGGKRGKRNSHPAPEDGPTFASPQLTPEELEQIAQSEPQYLIVTSAVEAALGQVVMGSRPSVFSSIATFNFDEPVSTYYIRLVRPGSLAFFVFQNYIHGNEDTQADFLCDVLETDVAEVDPFTCPTGEVQVDSADNLADMPPCAWGIGSSEDNERRLYTMYALVKQPPRQTPAAIVQYSLNMNDERDEVLLVVTLVDKLPQYAKVSCMVRSDVRSAEALSHKQAAILSFTRSGFVSEGFVEVAEAEVKAALSRARPARVPAVDLYAGRDRNAGKTFQPPVQLASLDQPAADAGISLGGVARGAMQGGMEVLKAPFTVGRVVGGALLDATGVTGAVRNNMEATFCKSFPELAGETIVDAFNCAWLKGSMPVQGYAFIGAHWLCFQSTVSAAKFSIEYDEIKDIVKSKSVKMFENALEIKTHLNDTIVLTSFIQRDQAYSELMKEWLKQ